MTDVKRLLLAVVLALMPSAALAVINDPVRHYQLEETSGTTAYDSGSDAANGTHINTPTPIDGKIAGALQFVAASTQTVTFTEKSFAAGVPFTLSYWKRGTTTTEHVGRHDATTPRIRTTSATAFGVVGNSSTNTVFAFAGGLLDDAWIFVCITRDASNNVRAYINGVQSGTGALTNADAFGFSSLARRLTTYTDIKLDDVRIYNRELSAADVTELYAYPTATTVNVLHGRTGITTQSKPTSPTAPIAYALRGGTNVSSVSINANTGLIQTNGAALAVGSYEFYADSVDASATPKRSTTRYSVVVKPKVRGGTPLGMVPRIPQPFMRSGYAFDVPELLLSDNTISITPASHATWAAFLTANPTLTGKIVLLGEGDYTSWGTLALDVGEGDGTATRRVVFKYNGTHSDLKPWQRPGNQAVIQQVLLTGASHYLFYGLKLDNSAVASQYAWLADAGSDDCILDTCWCVDPDQQATRIKDSDDCGVQFCRLERINERSAADVIALNTRNTSADVINPRFVGNELINWGDGIQFTGAGANPETLYTRSAVIADNRIYCTAAYRASLTGAEKIENGIDIKIGGETAAQATTIRGNKIWGYRTATGGEAIVIQRYTKYVNTEDNIFLDNEVGYRNESWPAPPGDWSDRVESVLRNTFSNITNTLAGTNAGSSIMGATPLTLTNNIFRDGGVAHKQAPGAGVHTYSGNTYINMLDSTER